MATHPTPATSDNPHITLTEEEKLKLNEELSGLNNSELVEGTAETVRKKKKNVTWAWKIKCGLCNNLVQLRIDGAHAGRVSYFKTHHYDACKSKKTRKRPQAQKTLSSFFAKKAKETESQADDDSDVDISDLISDVVGDIVVVEENEHFSDIEDLSDSEAANITSPVMEGSQEDSDLANDPDESDESIAPEYYDKEWRLVAVGVENADPVCVKLNDLIQRGKVSKNQILYKYHKYDSKPNVRWSR
ncbi:uncharacterized protein LOC114974222 [Acropora millepora]|uniref:uncharacterized protein LOC114974222 n=1 Tax=Acropora millepora TaxID=45264 RepID=UPI001CF10E89|nr:uncharacterized protein LOC114974222 [Acropora millepora]